MTENGESIPLGRGIRTGSLRDYQTVAPGKYLLIVRKYIKDRKMAEGKWFSQSVAPGQSLFKRKVDIKLEPETAQTIVLRGPLDRLSVQIVNDDYSGNPEKRLRLFHFAKDQKAHVFLMDGENEKPLWQDATEGTDVMPMTGNDGLVVVQAAFPTIPGKLRRIVLELDYRSVPSYSLVILNDRYQRTTALVMPDVPPKPPEKEKDSR